MNSKRVPAKAKIFTGALCAALLTCVIAMPAVAMTQSEAPPKAGSDDAEATMAEPTRVDTWVKLTPGQTIDVNNPYGNVSLRISDTEHTLEFRSILQQPDGAAKISMNAAARGGRYVIAPQLPDGVVLAEGQRLDLVLYVPAGHAAHAVTTFGDIGSRDVKSDVSFRTESGSIGVRGTAGVILAETSSGRIEAMLAGVAPARSKQIFRSRTGSISIAVSDKLAAEVTMSTSAMIGSDYSALIEHHDDQEPDKIARSRIGISTDESTVASLEMHSLVGDVRLIRIPQLVEP